MSKQRFCFLQVSNNLLNPIDVDNPADVYFKAIWNHLDGEGYFKPEHYWEIPTWIAELNYCLDDRLHEKQLFHITSIGNLKPLPPLPILPKADIYLGSLMDCNKEYFRVIVKNNPDKEFRFGGYIGYDEFCGYFGWLDNAIWYENIEEFCDLQGIEYQYGTDYSLFKRTKCIPRLTLSNGCTHHCRFCTIPNEIIKTDPLDIWQQITSMRYLDFELVYINDKTFGQCPNYKRLGNIYKAIKVFHPEFRGFIVQTTCDQVMKFDFDNIYLKDLGVVTVELGIESYNDDILRKYRKPQDTRLIDLAINVLENQRLNIIPNIIIGLPGETWLTYANTDCWIANNAHKFLMLNVTNFVSYSGNNDINTIEKDFNENSTDRSYHTAKEKFNIKFFTENIFDIGMEILKNTKARTIC